jgi:hypothetical protein
MSAVLLLVEQELGHVEKMIHRLKGQFKKAALFG